ncbi:ras-related protein Rab-25-like isoform X2 [Babylonia areolata]
MASGEPSYKVILCGEYGVGKSSIFRRFLHPGDSGPTTQYRHEQPSLGLDQCTRPFTVGTTPVKLTLWDTGGMERMSFIGASYYRGANAALLCYNSNNKDTFTILSQYILDIAMNAEGAKIFLCGNDSAGGEGKEGVGEEDMEAFMEEGGDVLSGVYSVSCRDNRGLEDMFRDMARVLHEDALKRVTLPRDVLRPQDPGTLGAAPPPAQGNRCC